MLYTRCVPCIPLKQGKNVVLVAMLTSVPFATAAAAIVLVAKRSAAKGTSSCMAVCMPAGWSQLLSWQAPSCVLRCL